MNDRQRPSAGACLNREGATFILHSFNATRVDLCLFEEVATDRPRERFREVRRLELERGERGRFEISVPGITAGQLYGYRVDGPWRPETGHRFDPQKLLIDPCARALKGALDLDPTAFGLAALKGRDPAAHPSAPPGHDTAGLVPLSMVIDDQFDWRDVRKPTTDLADGVIYEAHVRGMTMLHPDVPAELRGTYLGMAHEAIIEHLSSLSVRAVELMPVAHSESEIHLRRLGLTNYWGYSPLAFCAPDARFATGDDGQQVDELKTLVRELHRAGIAVLVDVVLNHTVEGDIRGPTLSLRGLDNQTYYRLDPDSGQPVDYTGCGNTLDFSSPMVVDLALHTLEIWARELRVDGFRFDLAPVIGRGSSGFDAEHPFFERLHVDPLLSGLHLIAEPWDLGPNGYALGRFPGGWLEWNDRYRQTMRTLWQGHGIQGSELMLKLSGSRETFGLSESVDYITSHDGFTLEDLVSFEQKHNLDNGEGNRDGSDHNNSRNWGVEGPSQDPEINQRRGRVKRGLLSMLALSQATSMLLHGDELGRTQNGNNNAYCQDNTTTWIDWSLDSTSRRQLEFTRHLFRLRRRLRDLLGPDPEIELLSSNPETEENRQVDSEIRARQFAIHLRSRESAERHALILVNAHERVHRFEAPGPTGRGWKTVLDTTEPSTPAAEPSLDRQEPIDLEPFTVRVLVSDSHTLSVMASTPQPEAGLS